MLKIVLIKESSSIMVKLLSKKIGKDTILKFGVKNTVIANIDSKLIYLIIELFNLYITNEFFIYLINSIKSPFSTILNIICIKI
jgi:hypothetical protein